MMLFSSVVSEQNMVLPLLSTHRKQSKSRQLGKSFLILGYLRETQQMNTTPSELWTVF